MHVVTRLTFPALLAVAIGMFAHAADNDVGAPGDKQLNQLYWQGQEDLKKSDWNAALKHFGDLEQQLRVATVLTVIGGTSDGGPSDACRLILVTDLRTGKLIGQFSFHAP